MAVSVLKSLCVKPCTLPEDHEERGNFLKTTHSPHIYSVSGERARSQ